MAKQGQQPAKAPATAAPVVEDSAAVVADPVVTTESRVVSIPPAKPAPVVVNFVTALSRLALAASKNGQHQQHAVLHDLEVRAGSLLTHAVSAEAHLDGEAAELVRQLRRIL